MSQRSEGSQPMETPVEPVVNQEGLDESLGTNATATSKKSSGTKRKRSVVWEHFTKIKIALGVYEDANCNHCKKKLSWKSNTGTSSLAKHLRGPCPNFTLRDDSTSSFRSPRCEYKFDSVKSRRDLAVACIKHNYPFNMGEHEYFEAFLNGLNPNFRLPSRNTIRSDVIGVFEEEKINMYSLLDKLSCKVLSLTTDIWTSDHSNKAYCCMTAHYIDESWELHKKILAFKLLEYPHDGDRLFNFMKDMILEWNLDKKMSSVVVDNATANTSMIQKLKSWLVSTSSLPLSGDLLHVRCSAHILNLIVQDGLGEIRSLLDDIRHTVRYIERTPSAMQLFKRAKQQCKLEDRKSVAHLVVHQLVVHQLELGCICVDLITGMINLMLQLYSSQSWRLI